MKHLLEVEGLGVEYHSGTAWHPVLEDVSFTVAPGEIVGVIGESGCGKSTLAKAILGLMPPGGRIAAGQVRLEGRNLVGLTEAQYRQVRWRRIAMVFQSAMNALNPMYRVGDQIAEPIVATGTDGRRTALQRAGELLELVGVPRDRVTAYPHELSGGMRQRVCIAMALALNPKLILADEPTTALDVITQERILDLLKKLRDTLGISVILISHDLSVIAEACDQVVVLYGGRVVERGPSQSVLHRSFHPYTMGLRNAFPELDSDQTLVAIPGHPPVPGERHAGCVFAPRCPFAIAACHAAEPALVQAEPGHHAACPLAREARTELADRAGRPETWRTGVAV